SGWFASPDLHREDVSMVDGRRGAVSRRTFMQATALTAAGFALPLGAHASGSDVIRVGLVGCGGRGTGAARDCLRAGEGIELVAMGDLFPDRLEQSRNQLVELGAGAAVFAGRLKVTDGMCLTGFDAYQKVLASRPVKHMSSVTFRRH